MNIKPNCSICNNQRYICHQSNLIYSLLCNICLKAANNNINDTKQGKYIGEKSKYLIRHISEHASAIKRNNIISLAMAVHYSNVNIKDRTFSINLLPKCTGSIDR